MRILRIHAILVSSQCDEEDSDVEGFYAVEVDETLPDAKAASVALDIFHENIPVETLDDFIFTVLSEDGSVLEEDENHRTYSGTELGGDVWKIDLE